VAHKIEELFNQTVEEYQMINEGDNIIIGVSGGADSICLLFMMYKYAENHNFNIIVVHVNHMLRGEESDMDEDFVRNFCEELGVRFISVECDVTELAEVTGTGIEEAGRMARYKAFQKVAETLDNAKIAVGHHGDDNAETFLLNLIRGSDIKGLAGIEPVIEMSGYQVIRPLLDARRLDIEDFLKINGLRFRTDSTNLEDEYARNVIRLNILPVMMELNPRAAVHINEFSESLMAIDKFIQSQAMLAYDEVVQEEDTQYLINISRFKKLSSTLKARIAHRVISDASRTSKDISRVNVNDLLNLVDKQSGKQINLPYGVVAVRQYFDIAIMKKEYLEEEQAEEQVLSIDKDGISETTQILDLPNGRKVSILKIRVTEQNRPILTMDNPFTKAFDFDRVVGDLTLGYRASGDYIQLQEGKKTLKKFFIDSKIPQNERGNIPILKDEREVLWIVGHRISEGYKITSKTQYALLIKIDGGEDEHED